MLRIWTLSVFFLSRAKFDELLVEKWKIGRSARRITSGASFGSSSFALAGFD
jgi:hypothetical protein